MVGRFPLSTSNAAGSLGMASPTLDCNILLPNRRRLAYAEYADADGGPVFVFHGLPGSRLLWGLLPGKPFPPGLRIITPDRPSYGRSKAKPGRRTMPNWADDIRELVNALDIERFSVLGVSGGGPGALACAWKVPAGVISASVVSTPVPTDAPGVFRGMSRTNRFFMRLAWRHPWLSELNTRFLGSVIPRGPIRYIRSGCRRGIEGPPVSLHRKSSGSETYGKHQWKSRFSRGLDRRLCHRRWRTHTERRLVVQSDCRSHVPGHRLRALSGVFLGERLGADGVRCRLDHLGVI